MKSPSSCMAGLGMLLCLSLLPLPGQGIEAPQLPGLITRIKAAPVDESSGLCPSRLHKGVFWTHNDSGDGPRLYAIHLDGHLVASYRVKGAKARDWEDIAVTDSGLLYIADVGNNTHTRSDLTIYVVAEPKHLQPQGTLEVQKTIPVAYPDGNYNCEALFLDADDLPCLITKDPGPARIYRFEKGSWTFEQELPVADVITGADRSNDGRLAVSSYLGFAIFTRNPQGQWAQSHRTFAFLEQCEAICWHSRNNLLLTSEQRALFHFRLDSEPSRESIFKREVWDPADPERSYEPLAEGQEAPGPIKFQFKSREKTVVLTLHAPWKKHSGRAVLLFSADPPGKRTQPGPSEHRIEVSSQNGRLRLQSQQFGGPGKPLQEVELPIHLEQSKDQTLELHFSAEWLAQQQAFAACFFGFNSVTAGWPVSYFRLSGAPLLWAERKTAPQEEDKPE